eukprot:s5046_g1.t1
MDRHDSDGFWITTSGELRPRTHFDYNQFFIGVCDNPGQAKPAEPEAPSMEFLQTLRTSLHGRAAIGRPPCSTLRAPMAGGRSCLLQQMGAARRSFACLGKRPQIYRHDLVDGEVREVSCESLDDCYEKGIMTPGMMLHRMWDEALRRRQGKLDALQNESAMLVKQMQVRRILRRMLGAGDPQRAPSMRMVRP